LLTTAPFTVTASAPTTTRSISEINDRTAESTIKFVLIPTSFKVLIVMSPWFLGRTSVAKTSISFPSRCAAMMQARATSELQWVMIVSPSRMWREPNAAIRSTACCEDVTNSSARVTIPAFASSTVEAFLMPAITMWTAFGSETAVGRVARSVSAACVISILNDSVVAAREDRAPSRSASAAARAIRPAPRISMRFILSAVSDTIIKKQPLLIQ